MDWLSWAFGCEPDEVSALDALFWPLGTVTTCAWFEGENEMLNFVQGTRSLENAMIEDSGADVRTFTPVKWVE